MTGTQEKFTDWILKQVFEESPGELSSKDPIVVSCGGIYIPHPESRRRVLQHVLVTPNNKEPVKVMNGAAPRNTLREILAKESMN